MDTNNSKKRKNKQQNVSGESQQKFALNSSQSGEFIVPRMSNNTQSESSSVCDTSSQSVTADQANEANQSTPSTDKGVTLQSMIGNQVSPLGPQGPQAKFVGVGSFTPIPSNSDLSDKIDNLTKMMTNMNKKLNKLDEIENKLNRLDNAVLAVTVEVTAMKGKVQEMEESMTFINNEFESNKDEISTVKDCLVELNEKVDTADGNVTDLKSDLNTLNAGYEEIKNKQVMLEARSMRDNLLFTGISELENENTEDVVKLFIKREMKINDDIAFERVHRIGQKQRGKHRAIVAKFSSFKEKEEVRKRAPRALKNKSFGVNEQFPKEINDKRKLLYPHYKEAKRQNKKAVLNVDRLFIDGTEFKLPDDRMEIGNGNHGRGHGSHTITTPPRLRNNRSNGAWQGVRDRGGGGAAQ